MLFGRNRNRYIFLPLERHERAVAIEAQPREVQQLVVPRRRLWRSPLITEPYPLLAYSEAGRTLCTGSSFRSDHSLGRVRAKWRFGSPRVHGRGATCTAE